MKYFIWWVPNLAELLENIKEKLQKSDIFKILTLITFILISIIIYQLKKKLIIVFGLLEFVGGIWTIWSTFNQNFENNIIFSLAIGGGVFLLVNGIENIRKQPLNDSKKNKSSTHDTP
jgi:glucose dehydrogenase